MEGQYTGVRYVHSDAEIEARVWHEATKTMMYEQDEATFTGNSRKRYSIKINNFQINLYKSLPNFEKYDTISERKKLRIFSDFYLPIELGIDEYQEIKEEKITYTYEELKSIILEELENQLSAEIEDENSVINKQINEKEIDGGLEIQLIYETLENIGIEAEVEIVEETNEVEEIVN